MIRWIYAELGIIASGVVLYVCAPIDPPQKNFHNYIRTHMALDGKTPAEVAGIKVKEENKWLTIIQNAASSHKRVTYEDRNRHSK